MAEVFSDARQKPFFSIIDKRCAPHTHRYEHSEQAQAPHTNGPRDVPHTKDAALQGGMMVVLRPLFAAVLVVCRRYFVVAPKPFPATPLVVHRR